MKVITGMSAYEIDLENSRIKRFPTHADAPDLEGDGEYLDFLRILRLEVGESAVFLVSSPDADQPPFLRVTTIVKELIP